MSRRVTVPERVIQREAVAWLRSRGVDVQRRNVGSMSGEHKGKRWHVRYGEPGACDLWFVLPGQSGRHCELEIKRPGNWPRDNQILYMLRMNAQGAAAFWIYDISTLEHVYGKLVAGWHVAMRADGTYDMAGPELWAQVREESLQNILILFGLSSRSTAARTPSRDRFANRWISLLMMASGKSRIS